MYHDFAGREIEDMEMNAMRRDTRIVHQENKVEQCEVCEKINVPFTRVEVSQDGVHYTWLIICGDKCLQQIIRRWKQIAEILLPTKQEGMEP